MKPQKPKYHSLEELLGLIDEPNASVCRKILLDNRDLFVQAAGSSHNHQAWDGGYLDHIVEVMNIAVLLYGTFSQVRPLPFSLSDALLSLYLHDLEKPWRYVKQPDGSWGVNPSLEDKALTVGPFVEEKIGQYDFVLSDQHWNAIKYAEGEKDDYTPEGRTQTPLAAFVHLCDTWSGRCWFDFPAESDDPWVGASRRKYRL